MVGGGWQIAAWQSREADGRLVGLCWQELSHRRAGCASESRRRGQPGFLLKEKRGRLIGGNQTGERAARWNGKGRRRCSTGCGARSGSAVGAVGEVGEEQEAAGGEGVAPGAGGGHVGEDAGSTTSSANGPGAASSVITSISTSLTRCANCRLV